MRALVAMCTIAAAVGCESGGTPERGDDLAADGGEEAGADKIDALPTADGPDSSGSPRGEVGADAAPEDAIIDALFSVHDGGDRGDGANTVVECPAATGGGKVCAGSFTVSNAFDLAEIADCQQITGDLSIRSDGLEEVKLEKLEQVASLYTQGAGAIILPALVRVNGAFGGPARASRLNYVGGDMSVFSRMRQSFPCLSRLKTLSVGGEFVSFPRLEAIDGNLSVNGAQLDVPVLRTVGGLISLGTVAEANFPSLVSVPRVSATAGGSLVAPKLSDLQMLTVYDYGTVDLAGFTRIVGPATSISLNNVGTVRFAKVTEASNIYWKVRDRLSMPALRVAGNILLRPAAKPSVSGLVVELPALEEIGSMVLIGIDPDPLKVASLTANKLVVAGKISLINTSAVTELRLPSLEVLGGPTGDLISDIMTNADLKTVSFPSLTKAGSLVFGRGPLYQGNPALADFELGALKQGHVLFFANRQLPQCKIDKLALQLQQAALGGSVMSGDNGPTCPF